MKKRHILTVFLLTIFTLGIYVIYWLVQTRAALLKEVSDKKSIPSLAWFLLPFAALFLAVLLVSFVDSPDNQAVNVISILLALTAMFSTIGVACWWFYRFFKVLYKVTHGNDFALMYIVWFLSIMAGIPIWILLAQNDINKVLEAEKPKTKSVTLV